MESNFSHRAQITADGIDGDWEILYWNGREAVNQLNEDIFFVSVPAKTIVDFARLLGQPWKVTITVPHSPSRTISGIVQSVRQQGRSSTRQFVKIVIRPHLWLLTKTVRSRLFQGKTLPEILAVVLHDTPHRFAFRDHYEPHNLCVQYQESDFAFACRLLEEEGAFFWFEATKEGERLVLGDSSAFAPAVPSPKILLDEIEGGARPDQRIWEWSAEQQLAASRFQTMDVHFQRPQSTIQGSYQGRRQFDHAGQTHEVGEFHHSRVHQQVFPGLFAHRIDAVNPAGATHMEELGRLEATAARTAQLAAERELAAAYAIEGAGSALQMSAGHQFELVTSAGEGEYFIQSVEHELWFLEEEAPRPRSLPVRREAMRYANAFTCIPASIHFPYRPPLSTPRPRIMGLQSATVVGPANEEIWTDPFGRIKVHFPWDSEAATAPQDRSAWVRVSQVWAGGGWGVLTIPRIHQEVLVAFLDGDPDCPCVVGSVYNATNPPPVSLPQNKTATLFKSDSHRTSSPEAFNGFSFDDKTGHEALHLQAERNMVTHVKNNHVNSVLGQRVQHSGSAEYRSVGGLPFLNLLLGGASSGSGGDNGTWNKLERGADFAFSIGSAFFASESILCNGVKGVRTFGSHNTYVLGGRADRSIDPSTWIKDVGNASNPILSGIASTLSLFGGNLDTVNFSPSKTIQYGPVNNTSRSRVFEGYGGLDKPFLARTAAAFFPMPTAVAGVIENIVQTLQVESPWVLTTLHLFQKGGDSLVESICGKIDRESFRMIDAMANFSSGLTPTKLLRGALPLAKETISLYTKLKMELMEMSTQTLENIAEQSSRFPSAGKHIVVDDGWYTVKSSKGIDHCIYDHSSPMHKAQSRLTLKEKNALLSGDELVTLVGGNSVVEATAKGIRLDTDGTSPITLTSTGSAVQGELKLTEELGQLTVGSQLSPSGTAAVSVTKDKLMLRVGDEASGTSITLTPDKIVLAVGSSRIEMGGAAGGILLSSDTITSNGSTEIALTAPSVLVSS